jgi:hypothetical protein
MQSSASPFVYRCASSREACHLRGRNGEASLRCTRERSLMPRSARGTRLRPRCGLNTVLRRKVPTSAVAAQIGALGAWEAASRVGPADGPHRHHCFPAILVFDLRALRHVDVPRLVALGGLTSCPVRGSRLIAISRKNLQGSLLDEASGASPLMPRVAPMALRRRWETARIFTFTRPLHGSRYRGVAHPWQRTESTT